MDFIVLRMDIIKSDVYESFYMSNTTTDYELLKDLAKMLRVK